MAAVRVTEHVYYVENGDVRVYLIVEPESLTLVDTGFPGTMPLIDEGVRSLGRDPHDIHDIIITHHHIDHAGDLAEILRATDARVWMHPDDADLTRIGQAFREYEVSPGEENQKFWEEVISKAPTTYEPAPVDHEVIPGEVIPVAGGILAIGTPGHTEGHLVYLWRGDGGVAFIGDLARNFGEMAPHVIYEDFALAMESLKALGEYDFDVACFAHGDPIVGKASEIIRDRWK
jgi:glyoxylase-like metal-dependent hydrolase (beta-lactamase superfamily II)